MPELCGWDLSGINARPTAAVLKGSLKVEIGFQAAFAAV